MKNFEFLSSTKIVFGKGCHKGLGKYINQYAGSGKVLFHYGSGSIKKTGLYDEITALLKEAGIQFLELGGAQPNPRLSLVREGIGICRKENVRLVLAVGGGSAIDSAKAIAAGTLYEGDVWDFFSGKAEIKEALPVITVLTIPAAGSENSHNSVITNEDGLIKKGCASPFIRPVVSFLNPEFCRTLPDNQVVNGISDIMAHIMERYFTNTPNVDLTDRLSEAALRTVINNARKIVKDKGNYDVWAEIMWTGSIAHNGLLGTGREEDWSSHQLEHELSAIYDVAHGAGLAVMFPAWMKYVYGRNINRFVQYAVRVWDVDLEYYAGSGRDSEDTGGGCGGRMGFEQIALEGIRRTEAFFNEIGLPTKLPQLGIDGSRIGEMALKALKGKPQMGSFMKLSVDDNEKIYRLAL